MPLGRRAKHSVSRHLSVSIFFLSPPLLRFPPSPRCRFGSNTPKPRPGSRRQAARAAHSRPQPRGGPPGDAIPDGASPVSPATTRAATVALAATTPGATQEATPAGVATPTQEATTPTPDAKRPKQLASNFRHREALLIIPRRLRRLRGAGDVAGAALFESWLAGGCWFGDRAAPGAKVSPGKPNGTQIG